MELLMLCRIKNVGMIAALLVLTASAGARAEDATDNPEPRAPNEEGRKAAPQRAAGDEAKRRNDPKSPNERGSSNDRKSDRKSSAGAPLVPTRVNEAFTFPLNGGCEYSTTVKGTVRAIRSANEEPKFVPNLVVNAWISCQSTTEFRVLDNAVQGGPMTRNELEQAIELRASLLAETSAARCAYVPDFLIGDNKLAGIGVFYLCPAGGSLIGGGPSDDEVDESAVPTDKPARAPTNLRAVPERKATSDTRSSDRPERVPQDPR
jgi:hypothetical protein